MVRWTSNDHGKSNALSNTVNEEELAVVHSKYVVSILSYWDHKKVLGKNRSELKFIGIISKKSLKQSKSHPTFNSYIIINEEVS